MKFLFWYSNLREILFILIIYTFNGQNDSLELIITIISTDQKLGYSFEFEKMQILTSEVWKSSEGYYLVALCYQANMNILLIHPELYNIIFTIIIHFIRELGIWKTKKFKFNVERLRIFYIFFLVVYGGKCADSIVCWLMYRFDLNLERTTLCCLYVAMCGSYLRCVTRSTHIRIGELTVRIVFPNVAARMYRSSPLVPLDSCLTAAACLSCAF